jgi:hypothetical protein
VCITTYDRNSKSYSHIQEPNAGEQYRMKPASSYYGPQTLSNTSLSKTYTCFKSSSSFHISIFSGLDNDGRVPAEYQLSSSSSSQSDISRSLMLGNSRACTLIIHAMVYHLCLRSACLKHKHCLIQLQVSIL